MKPNCVTMKTFRFYDDENGNTKMVVCANDFEQHKLNMQFVFFTIQLLGNVTYDIQTSVLTW